MSLNHLIFHVENIHKYDFKQHEKLIWTGRKKKVDIWNANTLLLRQDYITFLSLLSQYPLYLHLVWIRNICEKRMPSITETGIIRFIGWHLISLFFHFSSDSVHFTNHLTVCFYYEAGRDREIARKFEILDRQNIDWIKRIKNIRINQYIAQWPVGRKQFKFKISSNHNNCLKIGFSAGESLHLTTVVILGGLDYWKSHPIVIFISMLTDFTTVKLTFCRLISNLPPHAT